MDLAPARAGSRPKGSTRPSTQWPSRASSLGRRSTSSAVAAAVVAALVGAVEEVDGEGDAGDATAAEAAGEAAVPGVGTGVLTMRSSGVSIDS